MECFIWYTSICKSQQKYMKDYDAYKESSYIMYCDVNIL